jgi:hypothetical protein
MKTDTLNITYNRKKELHVNYKRSDIERIDHVPEPSKLGFYHFHRKIGPKKAFAELKKFLIDEANKEILFLQEYIDEMNALQLPDWITNKKQ